MTFDGDGEPQKGDADSQGEGELEVALTFSYEPDGLTDTLFGVSEETLFEAFEHTLEAVGVEQSVEVSVLITTDEGIQALNRDYRGKDEATDVLSFPLLDSPLVEAPADQLWQPADPASGVSAENVEDAEVDGGDDDTADDEEFADDEDDVDVMDSDEDNEGNDEPVEGWPLHLGDVAIARETALRQAERAGHSAAYEVAFLFVHGVLHLVGYDDQTDAGYRAMVAIQEAVLARVGVAR